MIVGIAIGSKYFEWVSLKTLINTHEDAVRQELAIIEEANQLETKFLNQISKIDSSSETPLDETLENYGLIIKSLGALANKNREYILPT